MDHNKAKRVARVLALILCAAMIITSFSFVIFLPGLAGANGSVVYAAESKVKTDADLEKELGTLKNLIKEISKNYKDDVSYDTLVNGAFSGVLESLNDPYSVYYATTDESDSFMDSATAEFSGIGVSVERHAEGCRVVAPIPGGPAEKAGMRTGDIIVKVDGADVAGMELANITALLKGKEGTTVKVSVDRSGQSLDFTLTREKIQETTVYGSMLEDQIGYIQITQFGSNTDQEFITERLKLLNQGAKSLIIDVRNNPGGVMNAAASIANQLMVEKGPIFHFAQQGKIVETAMASGSATRSVPVALLVNEGSASASEALAGALQDSGTAVVVGTTTYGKGIAQQVEELDNGASYKLSMFYFLTPKEHVIDKQGIAPDYAVYNGLGLSEDQIEQVYKSLAPMTEEIKYSAGQTGLNVYAAQQRLEYLGYDVETTGTMDAATVEAVKKFQKEQGFSAYGGLDFTTMKAISSAFSDHIYGGSDDKQLAKAIELLKK